MNMPKQPVTRRNAIILSSLPILALTACSGQHATSEPTPQPTTAPPSQAPSTPPSTPPTPTPAQAPTPSSTTSTTAAAPSMTSTSATDGSTPPGPASATGVPMNTQGRDLTLGDFFNPSESLKEDLYNVATTSKTKGIGAYLRDSDGVQAELRLENRFTKLTFKAGQANDSKSSDLILRVATYKDGKNDQLIDVLFNEIKPVEIDVSNVNALKIDLIPLDQNGKKFFGSNSLTGVMFDMRLE